MKLFKDSNNEVFAIPQGQEHLVQAGWVEITAGEREEILETITEKLTHENLSEILDRLMEIDVESIRPLRAIATNTDSLDDHRKLSALNSERKDLVLKMKVIKRSES